MINLIAFDFDGTLADSVDFCLAVFEKVLAKYMGGNAPDQEDVYQNFGMNEFGILRHYMGKVSLAAEADFCDLHRQLHPQMCPDVYPGIREFLDFLKSKGFKLTVLTGRADETCRISMDYLNLGKYFSGFQTGSPDRNDKTAQLVKLAADNHLSPDEVVYVGDAVSDVKACVNAGIKCLSAAWAKSARIAELERINPGLVFTSVKSMQQYIELYNN